MNQALYSAYVKILEEELVPAMGCTEPIAVAYAAALARKALGEMPQSVEVHVSANIIKNVKSEKMGRKDILKIDQDIDINLDVLGYIDPDISVNIIKDGKLIEKRKIELPEKLIGIKKCTNPRCITTTEQGITHIFKLTDREKRIYRCIYCDADK